MNSQEIHGIPYYCEFKERGMVKSDDEERPEEVCYIVMDFIDGVRLEDFRHLEHHSEESVTRQIAHQLIKILHDLHTFGVAHCNIKPDNIIATSDGKLKLIGFGSWKLIAGNKVWDNIGTPWYNPPQVYPQRRDYGRNKFLVQHVDLFAFAATLYFLRFQAPPVAITYDLISDEKTIKKQ